MSKATGAINDNVFKSWVKKKKKCGCKVVSHSGLRIVTIILAEMKQKT